jgi:hypothetical protein
MQKKMMAWTMPRVWMMYFLPPDPSLPPLSSLPHAFLDKLFLVLRREGPCRDEQLVRLLRQIESVKPDPPIHLPLALDFPRATSKL